MDDASEKTPFEQVVELFTSLGVRFIVIGGQAETLYGNARVTFDLDICYERTAENLARLADALKKLHPTLRGAPPDLPFRLDAESLAAGTNFTLRTSVGDLDLIGYVEPLGGFEAVNRNATTFRTGDVDVQVIGLDDLIRVKQYLGRPKDRESLMHLLAVKRLLNEDSSGS